MRRFVANLLVLFSCLLVVGWPAAAVADVLPGFEATSELSVLTVPAEGPHPNGGTALDGASFNPVHAGVGEFAPGSMGSHGLASWLSGVGDWFGGLFSGDAGWVVVLLVGMLLGGVFWLGAFGARRFWMGAGGTGLMAAAGSPSSSMVMTALTGPAEYPGRLVRLVYEEGSSAADEEESWWQSALRSAALFGLGAAYEFANGMSFQIGGTLYFDEVVADLDAPFQYGRYLGAGLTTVAGLVETVAGIFGMGGGGALCATGVGCVAGAPAVAGSEALVLAGIGHMVSGAGSFSKLIFEPAPYHGKKTCGRKSPGPTNGQKTLENSVPVKETSKERIGYDPDTDEIVVFSFTQERNGAWVYHGHVRTWDELKPEHRKALQRAGLFNNKGKYIGGK